MDSDDNMHHANDVDSLNEDYSGNDTDNDDDDGCEFENVSGQPKSFTVLKEEDIRKRQHDDIDRISTVLSVPIDSACTLLRCYNWNVNKVHEEWFADEDRVRNAVGLLKKPRVTYTQKNREVACGICFESYRSINIITTACGHPFCGTCWTAYISTSINDGPGCLTLKCPTPSCGAAVGVDMVNMLASDEDKDKYHRYLLRSYVEDNMTIKWCPSPGCDCAVEYDDGSCGSFDVSCLCSYSFCWNCTEDSHRPVDCDTVAKWILTNSDESENTTWILANSKLCPKCKRAIEKNQGCDHMTCGEPCKFQFCWLCLGAWSDHSHYYGCNPSDEAAEDQRKVAKKYILRYTHYYERWATNRKKVLEDLHQMQTVHVKKLSEKLHQPETQLDFIIEGWLQIVECRRVLKWTYAYGYYLPEQEHAKRRFFEYLQGEAVAGLERLRHCAENELQNYLVYRPPNDFDNFRTKLIDLTSVTRNYFENLVRALENGLSEVESQVVSSSSHI